MIWKFRGYPHPIAPSSESQNCRPARNVWQGCSWTMTLYWLILHEYGPFNSQLHGQLYEAEKERSGLSSQTSRRTWKPKNPSGINENGTRSTSSLTGRVTRIPKDDKWMSEGGGKTKKSFWGHLWEYINSQAQTCALEEVEQRRTLYPAASERRTVHIIPSRQQILMGLVSTVSET